MDPNMFIAGLALSRNRPSNSEKIRGALQAGQFSSGAPIGLVLMKQQVDQIERLEAEVQSLTQERDALASRPPANDGKDPDIQAKLEEFQADLQAIIAAALSEALQSIEAAAEKAAKAQGGRGKGRQPSESELQSG
jgi:Skp family chaperone for outer membrane proteins